MRNFPYKIMFFRNMIFMVVLLPKYFLYFKYLIETPFRNQFGCLFPSMTPFLHRGIWKISIGLLWNVDFNIPISLNDSLEKTLMLENIKSRRRRGWQRMKMVGWHHHLNGHEFEQTLGDGDGQGSLACCSPWGNKESDTIEQLNN